VAIIGYADLPSRLSKQSSTLYATNLFRLSEELCKSKDGTIDVNMDDEVLRGTTVVKDGTITWPPPAHRKFLPRQHPPPHRWPTRCSSRAAKKSSGHGKPSARLPSPKRAAVMLLAPRR
jgi:NAD(P) transhydrogenase subunit alpha